MSEKIKKIGFLGMAIKNQANDFGLNVMEGQLAVISEGYDRELWEPVTISQRGGVFAVYKPLTFEKIKSECVAGESLLVDQFGKSKLYLGFNRRGNLVTDNDLGEGCTYWGELEIKDWKISDKKWSEE